MRAWASSSASFGFFWPTSADWIAVAMVSPIAGHCGTRGRHSTSVSCSSDSSAAWMKLSPAPFMAAASETQARTSYKFAGPAKRSGVNRISLWRSPEFAAAMQGAGDNFINAALESLEHDTDVDWRPRVPQWPAIGETMATAIQSALVGQKQPKEALDAAQARIQQILKG